MQSVRNPMNPTRRLADLRSEVGQKKQRLEEGINVTSSSTGGDCSTGYQCRDSPGSNGENFARGLDEAGLQENETGSSKRDTENDKLSTSTGKTIPLGEKEKRLLNENADLKRKQNCTNCGQQKRNALQIPCKCLLLCMACAEFEDVCPDITCRSNVVGIFEVKWSG